MAAADRLKLDLEEERERVYSEVFEPQLSKLGLSVEAIEKQNLHELNDSLTKINDLIANPKSLGSVSVRISGEAKFWVVASASEAHIQIDALPLLLSRKSLILARIRLISAEQKVDNLKDLVASVAEPEIRARLQREVQELEEQSRRRIEQESAATTAQAEEIARRDEAVRRLQAELLERKLKAWTGFLSREPITNLIGFCLLIILALVHIGVLVAGSSARSEILSNAFLIILGYFFGQSAARGGDRISSPEQVTVYGGTTNTTNPKRSA